MFNRLFNKSKSKSTQPTRTNKNAFDRTPNWKGLGSVVSSNTVALFDSVENCLYMKNGKVVPIKSRRTQTLDKLTLSEELHKFAIHKGLITKGQYIAIR